MAIFRRKGSRFYWYEFQLERKTYTGSTKKTTKREARAVERDVRASVAAERMPTVNVRTPPLARYAGATFDDMVALDAAWETRMADAGVARLPRYGVVVQFCLNAMLTATSTAAKARRLPFDLRDHRDELHARLARAKCEATGMRLDITARGSGRNPFAPSFDRIDCKGGYTYSNVRITSVGFNIMRGTMDDSEFIDVARRFLAELGGAFAQAA